MKVLQILVSVALIAIVFGPSSAGIHETWAGPHEDAELRTFRLGKAQPLATAGSATLPPPFGVHIVGHSITSSAWNALAKDIGVRWGYGEVDWNSAYASGTPTVGGAFRSPLIYGQLDNVLAAGYMPIVGIGGIPSAWLLDPNNPTGPMKSQYYNEFGRFLTAVVDQYKDQVKYWEINFGNFEFDACNLWGPYPGEYADVIKIAGPAIHAADASAIVVLGPLAYDWWGSIYNKPCPDGVFNQSFLDTVVQEGAAPYFDAISFNVYHRLVGVGPNKPWTTGPGKAKALRDKLPVNQRDKRFLISETGEPYTGTVTGNGPSTASPEMSARSVTQIYAQVLSGSDPAYGVSGVQIDAALWFTLDSYNAAADWYYGLVDNNTTVHRLAGADAYETATTELAGASFKELFNQSGTEGYVFDLPGGGIKTVVWATPWYTDSPVTVVLPGTGLRIVDKLGNPVSGTEVGGQTRVQVTGSPIYVGSLPTLACPWDFVSPLGIVDFADLTDIANYWHADTFPSKYDLYPPGQPDGKIDIRDITQVPANMGPCP